MSFKKDKRQETIIYLALWAILFITPVMHLYIRTNTGEEFNWSEVLLVWKQFAVFFIIFLIHNHLLAPILVYRQKRVTYLLSVIAIALLFQVYQCNHRPKIDNRGPRNEMVNLGDRPPLPPEMQENGFDNDRGPMREPGPRDDHRRNRNGRIGNGPENYGSTNNRPMGDGPINDRPMNDSLQEDLPLNDSVKIAQYNPRDYDRRPFRGPDGNDHPPLILGQHDIISFIILILMLGMNLGVKLYFKQRLDQKQMAELEKENLEQQLEYLKYQINPHFFMNTLNNIHALVDINPEKAKDTILELSKMMRFVLYEGNKKGVPLDRDVTFLQNYITLMKLRYTDKVAITFSTPDALPQKEVPPLLFITFVENSFKHGVSYLQDSFIDVSFSINKTKDKLLFTCRNSKISKEEDKHGGVGLSNVKKRLKLMYGDQYDLNIEDTTDTYSVTLSIPL